MSRPFPGSIVTVVDDCKYTYQPECFGAPRLRSIHGAQSIFADEPLLVLAARRMSDVHDNVLVLRTDGSVVLLVGAGLCSGLRLRVHVGAS